jgi:dihydrofolate synthase / folylpolyglutamate synthase
VSSYKCIHIAGTNGKGSTANYISNIMIAAGKKCGLFTSPHLLTWQERIKINGKNIDLSNDYEENLYDGGYFINSAKLAYDYFEKSDLDYAIIETGIGGKKDITMLFDADISIITTIAKDHTEILGKSLTQIAHQKAGIIRKGKRVYSHPQKNVSKREINEEAYHKRTHVSYLKNNDIFNVRLLKDGQIFNLKYDGRVFKDLKVASFSKVQTINAAMAFIVCLNEGVEIKRIRKGLIKPLKGRIEIINNKLVLDVAHNSSSLIELKSTLKKIFPGKKFNVMFATQKTKDIKEMSKIINRMAKKVFLVDLDSEIFYSPKDISTFFKKPHYLSGQKAKLRKSYAYAKQKSEEDNSILVVCGTFHLTGRIYSFINSV